jgi:TonB-linked SusC/RagA family outer membrane protein
MLCSSVRASRPRGALGLLLRALVLAAFVAPWPGLAAAQQATHVTGVVRDSSSEQPIANVRVQVVGTNVTTVTDMNGRFELNVPVGGANLSFTQIGYRPEVRPVAPAVNVTMAASAVQLQEVVVTALGIQRQQRSLPYSAQVVPESKLTDVPTPNVTTSLMGNVAGVHVTQAGSPFAAARVTIRGNSSILGQNQPLFVIDGVPIDNSAASVGGYGTSTANATTNSYVGFDIGNAAGDIDPNNIASITVLKGPNAAALYGARAANGAIVITTKKGESAPGGGGLGLTGSITTQFERPLKLPAYQDVYGQGAYGAFSFVDGNGGGTYDYYDESWGPKMDGRLIDQFFGKQQPWVAHPNNVSNFWQTGVLTTVNLAATRATTRNNVRLSATRTNEAGMYPSNTNSRTDVALAGGSQISDKWSAEGSLDYVNDDNQNQPAQAYDEQDPMQTFIWFGRQVDVQFLKTHLYRDPTDALTQEILAGNPNLRTDAPIQYSWNYSYHENPYWMATVNTRSFNRDRVLGHGSATYKLNDWLSVTGRIGRDWYHNHFRVNYAVNNISPSPLGAMSDVNESVSETNSDFLITANNRPLLPNLSVTVNAGGNLRVNNDNYSAASSAGGLVIPGVYTLGNSAAAPAFSTNIQNKKVNSLYGSASFSFHDWLTVDVTGRNDWSSTLPKGSNSFFYPSIGGAFIFTDALGINSSFLTYGKLRGSWTRVGNDTDPYQLAAVYNAGTAWAGQPTFTASDRLLNANLKPEQTTGEEVGLDLGLLNDRVSLNATLYQKSTTNQILPVSTSGATGYTSAVVNSGNVRNRGLELAATIKPVQTRDFQWNMTVNWSKNTNKVLSLYNGVQRIVVGSFWNVNVTADSGGAYGNLVGYKWMRDSSITLANGDHPIVVQSNGLPLPAATQTVLGNYNPDWVGGISTTLTYKRVSLSLSFDGQHGGQVYSVTKWFGDYAGVLKETLAGREVDWNQGSAGPGYLVPNAVYQNGTPDTTFVNAQDYFENTFYAQEGGILDASYVKLRDLRLAVDLPEKWANVLGFSGATLALVGHNLMLWDKQDIIDPETAFDTGNRQGVENGQLPSARSIGFSLSVRP